MNDKFRKLTITFSILFLGSFTVWSLSHFGAVSADDAGARHAMVEPIKEIAGYRNWTKVNVEPQLMQARTAQLCAALTVASADLNSKANPHRDKYISVYVNAIGREAMIEKLKPIFPEGSVIVKEKLPDKMSETPELLTVMIKRSKGFNAITGDWEYMVVDGSGTKVEARGKLENCQGCHLATPQTDFIFRSYLTDDVRNRLK